MLWLVSCACMQVRETESNMSVGNARGKDYAGGGIGKGDGTLKTAIPMLP